MIRELRDDDLAAVAAVEQTLVPPELFVTEAWLRHELRSAPPQALRRMWVAVEDGEVVGHAGSFFRSGIAVEGAARIAVSVRRDLRRRGVGSALYETAEEHLRANGGTRVYAEVLGDPDGERFLRARGFEEVAREQLATIDPARVDVSGVALPAGYRLVPLRELRHRLHDLWELDTSARLDVPSDTTRTRLTYEAWLPTVEDPELDDDGSFVALHGDRPVAYAFLAADRELGRAVNAMTGTLSEHRRRGLARACKLASLGWARDNGIRSVWTGNDADNAGMLALNEELGYRPLLTTLELAKPL